MLGNLTPVSLEQLLRAKPRPHQVMAPELAVPIMAVVDGPDIECEPRE